MFGHVLRLDENTPAFASLKFALTNNLKSRKGRHQSNRVSVVKCDLKSRDLELNDINDLINLKSIAAKRSTWKSLF